jgi:hypothetical protein
LLGLVVVVLRREEDVVIYMMMMVDDYAFVRKIRRECGSVYDWDNNDDGFVQVENRI